MLILKKHVIRNFYSMFFYLFFYFIYIYKLLENEINNISCILG